MPHRTSGLAIAGFILSFFCGLVGLIVSILGYNDTKNNPNVGGQGLAIAGIIISSLGMLLSILVGLAG